MKKLLFAILILIGFAAKAQYPQGIFIKPNNSFGTDMNRGRFDSAIYIPTGCGVPTDSTWLFSQGTSPIYPGYGQKLKMAAKYYDSCGHHEYVWDPSLLAWHVTDSSSGGGGSTYTADGTTLSLSGGNQFSINNGYTGQSSIVILGNVNSGIWQSTPVADLYIASSANWNAKLNPTLNSAYFFVGNSSNVATGVAMSGDGSLNNAGAFTLAPVGSAGSCTNCNITWDGKGRGVTYSNGTGGSGGNPFADNAALVMNAADHTRTLTLSAAAISTGTNVTWIFPNVNGTVARSDAAQTFTGIQSFTSNPVFNTSSAVGQVWTASGTAGQGGWASPAVSQIFAKLPLSVLGTDTVVADTTLGHLNALATMVRLYKAVDSLGAITFHLAVNSLGGQTPIVTVADSTTLDFWTFQAGTNTTFDTTTHGILKISSTGGIPASDTLNLSHRIDTTAARASATAATLAAIQARHIFLGNARDPSHPLADSNAYAPDSNNFKIRGTLDTSSTHRVTIGHAVANQSTIVNDFDVPLLPSGLYRYSDSICNTIAGVRVCVLDSAGGAGSIDTLNTVVTHTALKDSSKGYHFSLARGTVIGPGDTVVVFTHSYGNSVGATDTLLGWVYRLQAATGCVIIKYAVSGSTVMKQAPVDYQGALSGTERIGSIIPWSKGIKALIIDMGLNDAGQTAAAYTAAHYAAGWDTIYNIATTTLAYPARIVYELGVEYINSTGLAYYGSITGNPSPTFARMRQFDSVNRWEAVKWDANFVPMYDEIYTHDSTLLSPTPDVHPNNLGYLFIFANLYQKMGLGNAVPYATLTPIYQTLIYGSTTIWNQRLGSTAQLTLTGNTTLAITNAIPGMPFTLIVHQDGTGGRTISPPSSSFSNTGSFVPNPAPSAITIMKGVYDSANYIWDLQNETAVGVGNPVTNFISELTALGYTPGSTEQTGYQTFYDSVVSQGLYSNIVAFYPFSGTTTATQGLNFVNPATNSAAYYITWNGTTTNDATGWTASSTGYANTNILASGVLAYTNAAMTVWQTNSSVTANQGWGCIGSGSPSPYFGVNINYDGANSATAIGGNDALISIANPSTNNCFTISRTSSTALSWYANGSSIGSSSTSTAVGLPAEDIFIGASNYMGTASLQSTQHYIFTVISAGLNSTQATLLYNDLAALKTAMGR